MQADYATLADCEERHLDRVEDAHFAIGVVSAACLTILMACAVEFGSRSHEIALLILSAIAGGTYWLYPLPPRWGLIETVAAFPSKALIRATLGIAEFCGGPLITMCLA